MESKTLGPHKISPLARLFPRHSDETYEALKRDIELHGQTEPIARHRGLILDGVHRLQACIDLGKKPRIVDLKDDVSPMAFVLSKNLHRRNLAKEERVVLAFRISEGSGPGRPSEGQGGHYRACVQICTAVHPISHDVLPTIPRYRQPYPRKMMSPQG